MPSLLFSPLLVCRFCVPPDNPCNNPPLAAAGVGGRHLQPTNARVLSPNGQQLLLLLKTSRGLVSSPSYSAALGRVCMKLVVVMGVTWVADVASWVFGGPDYIWLVTDLINALQGVFIFIVVGCQPQVSYID